MHHFKMTYLHRSKLSFADTWNQASGNLFMATHFELTEETRSKIPVMFCKHTTVWAMGPCRIGPRSKLMVGLQMFVLFILLDEANY
jgi:hypothetical protein